MGTGTARGHLDSPIQYLPGVGPQRALLFEKLGVKTVKDVLFCFPRRYIDARAVTQIAGLGSGERATIVGRILTMQTKKLWRGGTMLSVMLADDTGTIECVWFGRSYLERRFRKGDVVLLVGKVRYYQGLKFYPEEEEKLDIAMEDMARGEAGEAGEGSQGSQGSQGSEGSEAGEGKVIPVYPATQGLHHKTIRKIIRQAVTTALHELEETLPAHVRDARDLPTLAWAVEKMHFPADAGEQERARKRLAFEEFFYLQMLLALRHRARGTRRGIKFEARNTLVRKLYRSLPFTLTKAQEDAIRTIYRYMSSPNPMNVLVQGDVGSGKTVVSLFAMARALENGYKVAMMAPTEVLAAQHETTIGAMTAGLGVGVHLLTGAVKGKERKDILAAAAADTPAVLIGTHALIQEGVHVAKLGLVIVDEQHRFGVHQRVQLAEKGANPDSIVMTATPIPRSLAMTLYGDLDVVVIGELPPGRREVVTRLVREEQRGKVYQFVRDRMREGDQVFAIYPLIEHSDKLDLKAATEWHEKFRKDVFPDFRVSLVHGRMSHVEKDEAMHLFRSHELDLLVSTTVVEVGVDVPEASIIMIEHAERFGLSQLHQLRGRVGRGTRRGYCILFANGDLSETTARRLEIFTGTTDGFRIAEADLALRGPGELVGTKQHGAPSFLVADLIRDYPLLEEARALAFTILEEDRELSRKENAVLRREITKRHGRGLRLLRIG
jgi:ATP-dependent DNA helicase RecG